MQQAPSRSHPPLAPAYVHGNNGASAEQSADAANDLSQPLAPPPPPTQRPRRPRSLKDRLLDIGETLLDYFVRIIGPLLSITCVSLIALVTRAYFVEVLPLLSARVCHGASDDALRRYAQRTEFVFRSVEGRSGLLDERSGSFMIVDSSNPESTINSALQQQRVVASSVDTSGCGATYAITALGLYLLFCIVFHYFATMLLGPGRPPARLSIEVEEHLAAYDPERREDQRIRNCKACKIIKPMRAHHCRVCNACCLKMDHHCPWVNTCVGWRNHRHFISFLFFLWTGCGFFLLTSLDSAWGALIGSQSSDTWFLVAVIIAVAAFVAGSLFLLWSSYLLVSNQTTIEFYGNHWGHKPGNPYDLGAPRNIASVFGEMGLLTLLIPSLTPPPGNGIIFPLNAGRGMPLPMLIDERAA